MSREVEVINEKKSGTRRFYKPRGYRIFVRLLVRKRMWWLKLHKENRDAPVVTKPKVRAKRRLKAT